MKSLAVAFQFLTILPVPGAGKCSNATLHGAGRFFPVVGLAIGAIMALLAAALDFIFAQSLTACALALAMIAISGGLHMDGLADTADGFFSARPPEEIRGIMKDSRIGVMGVIAVVGLLVLKIGALTSMPAPWVWRAAFFAPLVGRCILLINLSILPSADPGAGLGGAFLRSRRSSEAIPAVITMAVVGWLLLGMAGLLSVIIVLAIFFLFVFVCYRKLGGATGDTLGAACEISELFALLVLSAFGETNAALWGAVI